MTETPRAPGIYPGVREAEYHTDPAVSQSQLKQLLRSPARYRYSLAHPGVPTAAMETGTVVHSLILGGPAPFVAVDADSWRTAAAKESAALARASGLVPLLAHELDRHRAVAEAVLAHPGARALLERVPEAQREDYTEVSAWWDDTLTGIRCRGRIDRLTDLAPLDVKTTADAAPGAFARSCVTYGYAEQAAYYGDGLQALGIDTGPMVFVVVESAPPHFVALYTLTSEFLDYGRARMRRALDTLAACRESDEWPGYADTITPLEHPYTRRDTAA